ncbi:conserved hypothetical protein [Catenulispora acidiphila DSM 44928]|uniref:TNT domain-containing protein n=1 Tax=Catenulispora acidiphila (strain DSM 44928 / JCM 14897 / NBRC 102108 / NRRL B-24433 / ID139908) TaxID=479433 RepID=C7PYW1_CATAD|nr:TNT domain-containing protein [Catenulispora acidiphila]ACU69517.1 conserved hypothetical protein [Catenulispora acidiphila DSM 44928]
MTENWQQEPAPRLSTARDRAEAGPESIPVMPHGLKPVPMSRPGGPRPDAPAPPYQPQSRWQEPQVYIANTYIDSPYTPPTPPPSQPPPTADPRIGNSRVGNPSDGNSTMMVAVGTVQPAASRPPEVSTVEEAERILGYAVDSLDADPDLYSIGTVTDGAVCLIPDDGRWSIFLADGGRRRYAGSFDNPEQAAIHFAGVLLIAAAERGALPKHAAGRAALPGRSTDPLAEMLAGPPITPLAGDPPTTLYSDQRLTILTPGTEVDRFGDQQGNTVYAARTRYPHRSLPPDYIGRPYRVYRVRDPLRALTGTAIPWFGQPGGGMAYLLPRPIRDLLHEGALVEIPSATLAPS